MFEDTSLCTYIQIYIYTNIHAHTKRWRLGKDLLCDCCFFLECDPREIFLSKPSFLLILSFELTKQLLMALLLLSPVFKTILIDHSNLWVLKSVNMYSPAFPVLCCNTPCLGRPIWDFTRTIFTHLHTDVSHSGLSSDLFFSRKNPTSVPAHHLQSFSVISVNSFFSNCFLSVSYQKESSTKVWLSPDLLYGNSLSPRGELIKLLS